MIPSNYNISYYFTLIFFKQFELYLHIYALMSVT